MALENVLRTAYRAHLEVPRAWAERVYVWSACAGGNEQAGAGGELNEFAAGKMFLVQFGSSPYDPSWAIDLLESQIDDAPTILGHLLNDALYGFPVPFS